MFLNLIAARVSAIAASAAKTTIINVVGALGAAEVSDNDRLPEEPIEGG